MSCTRVIEPVQPACTLVIVLDENGMIKPDTSSLKQIVLEDDQPAFVYENINGETIQLHPHVGIAPLHSFGLPFGFPIGDNNSSLTSVQAAQDITDTGLLQESSQEDEDIKNGIIGAETTLEELSVFGNPIISESAKSLAWITASGGIAIVQQSNDVSVSTSDSISVPSSEKVLTDDGMEWSYNLINQDEKFPFGYQSSDNGAYSVEDNPTVLSEEVTGTPVTTLAVAAVSPSDKHSKNKEPLIRNKTKKTVSPFHKAKEKLNVARRIYKIKKNVFEAHPTISRKKYAKILLHSGSRPTAQLVPVVEPLTLSGNIKLKSGEVLVPISNNMVRVMEEKIGMPEQSKLIYPEAGMLERKTASGIINTRVLHPSVVNPVHQSIRGRRFYQSQCQNQNKRKDPGVLQHLVNTRGGHQKHGSVSRRISGVRYRGGIRRTCTRIIPKNVSNVSEIFEDVVQELERPKSTKTSKLADNDEKSKLLTTSNTKNLGENVMSTANSKFFAVPILSNNDNPVSIISMKEKKGNENITPEEKCQTVYHIEKEVREEDNNMNIDISVDSDFLNSENVTGNNSPKVKNQSLMKSEHLIHRKRLLNKPNCLCCKDSTTTKLVPVTKKKMTKVSHSQSSLLENTPEDFNKESAVPTGNEGKSILIEKTYANNKCLNRSHEKTSPGQSKPKYESTNEKKLYDHIKKTECVVQVEKLDADVIMQDNSVQGEDVKQTTVNLDQHKTNDFSFSSKKRKNKDLLFEVSEMLINDLKTHNCPVEQNDAVSKKNLKRETAKVTNHASLSFEPELFSQPHVIKTVFDNKKSNNETQFPKPNSFVLHSPRKMEDEHLLARVPSPVEPPVLSDTTSYENKSNLPNDFGREASDVNSKRVIIPPVNDNLVDSSPNWSLGKEDYMQQSSIVHPHSVPTLKNPEIISRDSSKKLLSQEDNAAKGANRVMEHSPPKKRKLDDFKGNNKNNDLHKNESWKSVLSDKHHMLKKDSNQNSPQAPSFNSSSDPLCIKLTKKLKHDEHLTFEQPVATAPHKRLHMQGKMNSVRKNKEFALPVSRPQHSRRSPTPSDHSEISTYSSVSAWSTWSNISRRSGRHRNLTEKGEALRKTMEKKRKIKEKRSEKAASKHDTLSEDDPNHLWCLCRRPHNNKFMICCDRCSEWFHGKCVGITEAEGTRIDDAKEYWACPGCAMKNKRKNREKIPQHPSVRTQEPSINRKFSFCKTCKKKTTNGRVYCSDKCLNQQKLQKNLQAKHENPSSLPDTASTNVTGENDRPRLNIIKISKKDLTGYQVVPVEAKRNISDVPLSGSSNMASENVPLSSKPKDLKKPATPKYAKQSISKEHLLQHNNLESKRNAGVSNKKGSDENMSKNSPPNSETTRFIVRKSFEDTLKERASQFRRSSFSAEKIEKIAESIEEALYLLFNDTGAKYKAKFRSLFFNIKDPKNYTLFHKIMYESLTPRQLVCLSKDELASQELALWREREEKHELERIKQNELAMLSLSKTHVVKTHKGEQIIENEDPVEFGNVSVLSLERDQTITAKDDVTIEEKQSQKSGEEQIFSNKNNPLPINAFPNEKSTLGKYKLGEKKERIEQDTNYSHNSKAVNSASQEKSLLSLPAEVSTDTLTADSNDKNSTFPKCNSSRNIIWEGTVTSSDVSPLNACARILLGDMNNLADDLPPSLPIVGRISPETVYDYIKKVKSASTRDIVVLVFAEKDDDTKPYTALYDYFITRNRFGVIKLSSDHIKDFYIITLPSNKPLPSILSPLTENDFGSFRNNLLLGIIVTAKKPHAHSKPPYIAENPRKPSSSQTTIHPPEEIVTSSDMESISFDESQDEITSDENSKLLDDFIGSDGEILFPEKDFVCDEFSEFGQNELNSDPLIDEITIDNDALKLPDIDFVLRHQSLDSEDIPSDSQNDMFISTASNESVCFDPDSRKNLLNTQELEILELNKKIQIERQQIKHMASSFDDKLQKTYNISKEVFSKSFATGKEAKEEEYSPSHPDFECFNYSIPTSVKNDETGSSKTGGDAASFLTATKVNVETDPIVQNYASLKSHLSHQDLGEHEYVGDIKVNESTQNSPSHNTLYPENVSSAVTSEEMDISDISNSGSDIYSMPINDIFTCDPTTSTPVVIESDNSHNNGNSTLCFSLPPPPPPPPPPPLPPLLPPPLPPPPLALSLPSPLVNDNEQSTSYRPSCQLPVLELNNGSGTKMNPHPFQLETPQHRSVQSSWEQQFYQ